MYRVTACWMAALTFKKVERGPATSKVNTLFAAQLAPEGITIPAYEREYHAISAVAPDGTIVGGCSGFMAWGEMHIDMLTTTTDSNAAVPGTGSVLLGAMEDYGRSRGCHRISLETHTWQARPFYEKLGYTMFAEQGQLPPPYSKFFMQKSLMLSSTDKIAGRKVPAAAAVLKVGPADRKPLDELLHGWLEAHTVEGVAPHVKVETAMKATLSDGTCAATCLYETVWTDLHITHFAVNPAVKDNTITGAVLDKMISIAKEEDRCQVTLERMGWQGDEALWRGKGFCEIGVQHDIPPYHTRHLLLKSW